MQDPVNPDPPKLVECIQNAIGVFIFELTKLVADYTEPGVNIQHWLISNTTVMDDDDPTICKRIKLDPL